MVVHSSRTFIRMVPYFGTALYFSPLGLAWPKKDECDGRHDGQCREIDREITVKPLE